MRNLASPTDGGPSYWHGSGAAQIPQAIRRQLQSDGGLLFSFEGIPISVALKDFRAPGIFCGLRLMSFIGFFAASESRVVASASFFHKVCPDQVVDNPAPGLSQAKQRINLSLVYLGLCRAFAQAPST